MRTAIAFASIAAVMLAASAASAADVPQSFKEPPAGPGTERRPPTRNDRVREGVQADVNLGTGFSDTYGIGVGGRVGYAMQNGIYLGGALSYFAGRSVNEANAHAAFVGGEVGYKFFAGREARWEIRPYVFGGPAFVTTVSDAGVTESKTNLAIQPGVLGAYHFGDAFVQVDARYLVTPTPTTLAVFGGAGLAF